MSPEELWGAYMIAGHHSVMTRTHASETVHEEMGRLSTIEYFGERTLLGHCVHLDDRDRRLLAASDTRVAHNLLTDLALEPGVVPIPEMVANGITVGLGTDKTGGSDTVNMINDIRFAVLLHKGHRQDPAALTAEKVLEMATVNAARAVGRQSELGSIKRGKLADIVLLDLETPHLVPTPMSSR